MAHDYPTVQRIRRDCRTYSGVELLAGREVKVLGGERYTIGGRSWVRVEVPIFTSVHENRFLVDPEDLAYPLTSALSLLVDPEDLEGPCST